MTTQAPTEATLDRIERMTPHQIAQGYEGRAHIDAIAAANHAATTERNEQIITARARATLDYAAAAHTENTIHRLTLTAQDYAHRAAYAYRECIAALAPAYAAGDMTDEAYESLNSAHRHAHRANCYSQAARHIAHASSCARMAED